MPRAVLIVHTRPSRPDVEDEYNRWYHEVHIPEVCDVPGVMSGRHFQISPAQMNPDAPDPVRPYIVIYEINSDDVAGTLSEIARRRTEGVFQMSDALERDPPPVSFCYELQEG
jgi:hypothetical protein